MESVKSSLPQYIQIAESLLDQIESGELAPGSRLPSERTLSELFDVNRVTLRRALARLEAEGLVIRKHGRGNFIAEPKIERQIGRLVSFTDGMERRGLSLAAKVISIEQQPAQAAIARQLHLPVLAPVYYILRLRMINQEPVVLEQIWLPAQCFPDLEKQDLKDRPVIEVMKSAYGISITRAQRSLEPVAATNFEAELLDVELGAPLMMERRLGFDQDTNCVEFSKNLYRADRFRFVVAEMESDPPA